MNYQMLSQALGEQMGPGTQAGAQVISSPLGPQCLPSLPLPSRRQPIAGQ